MLDFICDDNLFINIKLKYKIQNFNVNLYYKIMYKMLNISGLQQINYNMWYLAFMVYSILLLSQPLMSVCYHSRSNTQAVR